MKLLLVTGRYPWPPRRGDQMRVVQHLELLGARHRVTLLTPPPPPHAPPPPATQAAEVRTYPISRRAALAGLLRAQLTGLPLQSGLYLQPALRRELHRLAPMADLVVLQLVRLAGLLGELGDTPYVVDLVDSLSLNFARRAELDRPWRRALLRFEAARLARAETRMILGARCSYVVCARDRDRLASAVPSAAAERLHVLPLVIDGGRDGDDVESSERSGTTLALTGNLGYFVNRDALGWWLDSVWPLLRRRRPEVGLVVAGARPSRKLGRRLRRAGGRLIAAPASLRPVLEQATVALAPLRCGSGVPVKVLEAWAAGTPVVASPWAAAGTTGRAGKELLLAESPGDWVATVERLLDDPQLRRRLAEAGRRRLRDDHSAERVGPMLSRLIELAVDAPAAGR